MLTSVCAELAAGGAIVTLVAVETFEDIQRLSHQAAASGDVDAIVAVGGDGTIRAAASALIGTELPLGVIALGTANVLAHEVGLPRSPAVIAGMLMRGPTTTVSCGSLDGEPFLLMASAGFDAEVLRRLSPSLKRTFGKLAYAGPILAELARRPRAFEALIDGRPRTCTWLIAANARHYAGSFVIAEGRDITQPGLDAVIVNAPTRTRLLRVLLAIASGRVRHARDVTTLACRSVEVAENPLVAFQLDGDVVSHRSLRILDHKLPLRLIVPEGTAGAEQCEPAASRQGAPTAP